MGCARITTRHGRMLQSVAMTLRLLSNGGVTGIVRRIRDHAAKTRVTEGAAKSPANRAARKATPPVDNADTDAVVI